MASFTFMLLSYRPTARTIFCDVLRVWFYNEFHNKLCAWMSTHCHWTLVNSRIFHPCMTVPIFPLPHFPPLRFWPCRFFHSRIFSRPKPNTESIGRRVAEIWPFEVFQYVWMGPKVGRWSLVGRTVVRRWSSVVNIHTSYTDLIYSPFATLGTQRARSKKLEENKNNKINIHMRK